MPSVRNVALPGARPLQPLHVAHCPGALIVPRRRGAANGCGAEQPASSKRAMQLWAEASQVYAQREKRAC